MRVEVLLAAGLTVLVFSEASQPLLGGKELWPSE